MSSVIRGPFQAVFSKRDGLFIHRTEDLTKSDRGISFAPAEGESLISLIVSLMRVEESPLLPKILKRSPFEAEFNVEREMEIRRRDQTPETGLRISFDEGDELIEAIRMATAGHLSESQGNHFGKASNNYWPTPDPPIEGR